MLSRSTFVLVLLLVGCGPSVRDQGGDDDPNAPCTPGKVGDCYSGQDGTKDVGPCHGGKHTCDPGGTWSQCINEVVPTQELCTDGIDNNCNGATDEDVDSDHDGFTTCGGDCCDSTECSNPGSVNPGAFDAPGNNFDDDCNGVIDDAVGVCDQNLASGTLNANDYAKAIDLCQTATLTDKKWGVISATLTLADGTGVPAGVAQSIRDHFGTGVMPKGGTKMALLSTGNAASKGDTNPAYADFQGGPIAGNNKESNYPADYLAANGGTLPNAPGCPPPTGNKAEDPVMLNLEVRVPTNAQSFKLAVNFFTSEFPEYTCSAFNDFFVVLLDSAYTGTPANPTDKNLAFYQPMGSMMKYPVGVNLASGDTGLFTQCVNGATGCAIGGSGSISTCTSTTQLTNTGLDTPTNGQCSAGALQGGGTGWLETSGNVKPGEIMKLRIAIWDTSDHRLDSIAIVDGFQWSVDAGQPGTVIFRQH